MNGVASVAVLAQAFVTLIGGGYALYKFASARGADQAELRLRLDRIDDRLTKLEGK